MIQQFLVSQGMPQIAKNIEKETNVSMECSNVEVFRMCVLNGQFQQLFQASEDNQGSVFDKITANIDKDKKQSIMYFIYEQQYIELMHQGKHLEAISLL